MTFRSLEMQHYLLIISQDHAYETINQLVKLECVHVKDISDVSMRPYLASMRRCEELSQKIQIMRSTLFSGSQPEAKHYEEYIETEDHFSEKLFEIWGREAQVSKIEQSKLLDIYQNQIQEQYEKYHTIMQRVDKLKTRKKQLMQKIACWEVVQGFFGSNIPSSISSALDYIGQQDLMKDNLLSGINYVVGVIPMQAELRFNRMIYRVSRGYACTRSISNFQFQGLQSFEQKVVMVIYPSSNNRVLQNKIMRVIHTFCSNAVDLDEKNSPEKNLNSLKMEFDEIQNLLKINQNDITQFVEQVSKIQCLQKWRLFVWKEKYLFEQLNKLEIRGQFMIASIYLPAEKLTPLTKCIQKISPTPTLQPLSCSNPPTAFDTNSYTMIAQEISDTYGVPRYQEINPSIFTTVTFPFFFGVMFGDAGHGAVLLALGIILIWKDDWLRKNNMKAVSDLRYMITLMGFFAFYCGWIYNDFIGFNYNIFGSCYDPVKPQNIVSSDYRPVQKQGCVYIFGLDPIWGIAENQLVFINGLKMKLSVIIGVIHMTLGIAIKAFNARFFKKKLDFYFEFIPQITFMVLLFGYMDFLIIFKWFKVWDEHVQQISPKQWAPSIINTMMNIGLKMGKTSIIPDGSSNMWGERGNTSQDTIQILILIIALICVPIMLFPKPLILISQLKKKKRDMNPLMSSQQLQYQPSSRKQLYSSLITDSQGGEKNYQSYNRLTNIVQEKVDEESEQQHEEPSQIFVHQLIQVIEFVLGTVSNTASYLRLWALSLAHSQLAKVFFQKTLQNGLQMQSIYLAIPSIIILFFMLCWITFGVLMCMDSMQCFLHSLRLHWVEFQNKFYKGDGYKYSPISVGKEIAQKKAETKK